MEFTPSLHRAFGLLQSPGRTVIFHWSQTDIDFCHPIIMKLEINRFFSLTEEKRFLINLGSLCSSWMESTAGVPAQQSLCAQDDLSPDANVYLHFHISLIYDSVSHLAKIGSTFLAIKHFHEMHSLHGQTTVKGEVPGWYKSTAWPEWSRIDLHLLRTCQQTSETQNMSFSFSSFL